MERFYLMMRSERPRILLVEDDDNLRGLCTLALRQVGEVMDFSRVHHALPHLGEADVLVTDLAMPGLSGLDLLDCVADQGRPLPTLVMTAHETGPMMTEIHRRGIPVLRKPFRLAHMLEAVGRLQDRASATWSRCRGEEAPGLAPSA